MRLKKSQAETQKQALGLDISLREMQEKCNTLENSKMELEKQVMRLRTELEAERRDRILGTEIIADLQGETLLLLPKIRLIDGCLKCTEFYFSAHQCDSQPDVTNNLSIFQTLMCVL